MTHDEYRDLLLTMLVKWDKLQKKAELLERRGDKVFLNQEFYICQTIKQAGEAKSAILKRLEYLD